jgi:hypothetical protein
LITDGKVTTSFGNSSDFGYAAALQSDAENCGWGYGIVDLFNDFACVRYNTDGSLDYNFDSDGKVTTNIGNEDDYGKSIAIQSDGKIILAGSTESLSITI